MSETNKSTIVSVFHNFRVEIITHDKTIEKIPKNITKKVPTRYNSLPECNTCQDNLSTLSTQKNVHGQKTTKKNTSTHTSIYAIVKTIITSLRLESKTHLS